LIGLVGAHGDALELLELAEEVFDEMPPFVHLLVDGERLCAARMLGNDDLGAARRASRKRQIAGSGSPCRLRLLRAAI
jgi:hypothetical protein